VEECNARINRLEACVAAPLSNRAGVVDVDHLPGCRPGDWSWASQAPAQGASSDRTVMQDQFNTEATSKRQALRTASAERALTSDWAFCQVNYGARYDLELFWLAATKLRC
jgi:hypothetical protein